MTRHPSGVFTQASVLVVLSAAIHFTLAPFSSAQTDDGRFVIRVQTREVVVPVRVLDKNPRLEQSPIFKGPKGWTRVDYYTWGIAGLSSKDFHIFEDGVEQKVKSVAPEKFRLWSVVDNVSSHLESSCTARGVWAGADNQTLVLPPDTEQIGYYQVSYIPPSSAEGACHAVKINVNQKNALVYTRGEYCNVQNPPDDALKGSKQGNQLAEYADSTRIGALPMLIQAVPFVTGPGTGRVNIALEFSKDVPKTTDKSGVQSSGLAILGMIYDKSGKLAARFSDSPCYSLSISTTVSSSNQPPSQNTKFYVAALRYETQVPLLPGEYQLKIVATDGERFGRVEEAVDLDFQQKPLNISGIALCKRYNKPLEGPGKKLRPAQVAPLAAKGVEFTPAGDTQFKKDEQLMTYVEIYSTQSTVPPDLLLEMKITDTKTGELKIGTGPRPIESSAKPGGPIIPVVWTMKINTLPPAIYHLEAQAYDSAGNKST